MNNPHYHATLITGGRIKEREEKANEVILSILKAPLKPPDFTLITPEEGSASIGIDKIRELKMATQLKSVLNKNKVVFIPKAQNLTVEAQNAFLKILEEPPKDCLFILTAPHSLSVLPTIASRCAIIKLPAAIDLLEDPLILKEIASEFIDLLKSSEGPRLDWVVKNLERVGDREEILPILNIWLASLRDLLMIKLGLDKIIINKKLLKILTNLAHKISTSQCLLAITKIQKTKLLIETTNVDKRLALEVLLLNLPIAQTNQNTTTHSE